MHPGRPAGPAVGRTLSSTVRATVVNARCPGGATVGRAFRRAAAGGDVVVTQTHGVSLSRSSRPTPVRGVRGRQPTKISRYRLVDHGATGRSVPSLGAPQTLPIRSWDPQQLDVEVGQGDVSRRQGQRFGSCLSHQYSIKRIIVVRR
jgi:hypothetical protein